MFKRLRQMLRGRSQPDKKSEPWALSNQLVRLSKKDYLTLARAVEGILVVGGTGSGKSSGSGRTIAHSFIREGYGGLVLCAKHDEARVWERYCQEAGRSSDLIIFRPDNPWRFNFLDFELQRGGRGAGLVENMVQLLSTIAEITKRNPSKGGGQDDGAYWEESKNELLRNLIDLVVMAKGRITVSDLFEVLNSAPKSIEQTRSAEWQRDSYCYQCLREAFHRPKSSMQEKDFRNIDRYWFGTFPELAEKTRSIVASTFTAMTDVMNRGILRELFCGETNVTPQAMEEGKIIVVDMPVMEFAQVGRYGAAIWKYCAQTSLQRRDVQVSPRPVFIWQDEAQHFVLNSDMMFQTTCRGYKVANVLLTQNISNFYATMGQNSEALVDSLFGNLNTKIFHSNGDFKTGEWMSQLIGKSRVLMASANTSYSSTNSISSAFGLGPAQVTSGVSEIFELEVQPSVCTTFRTGGPANGWLVDSLIVCSGSCFHTTGRPYLFCTFSQK